MSKPIYFRLNISFITMNCFANYAVLFLDFAFKGAFGFHQFHLAKAKNQLRTL